MTDAKPVDALADAKKIRYELEAAHLSGRIVVPLGSMALDLENCLAIWEKERAAFSRLDSHCAGISTDLATLRAAVEKVRDELRVQVNATDDLVWQAATALLREWADALDAALRGGE